MAHYNVPPPSGSPAAASSNVVHLAARAPERLVGVGFRCWMQSLAGADFACWEDALAAYATTLGPERARSVLIDLSAFARAVATAAEREISVQRPGCAGFCRDECLAISIVAACQHSRRAAISVAASALIGSDSIGDTVQGAQAFAHSLKTANQWLAEDSICPATCALRVGRSRLS